MLRRFYRNLGEGHPYEECCYVELSRELTPRESGILEWLLADPIHRVSDGTCLHGAVVEIGPRLSVETPSSSNIVAICESVGLPVSRVETSRRYRLEGTNSEEVLAAHLDPMTQEVYWSPLISFGAGARPEPIRTVPILAEGVQALREANARLGLGMDEWDLDHWTEFFRQLGRDPTDVELFQIGNGNSEHSRHWLFRGIQEIDGIEMPESLMDIVKAPWRKNPNNSLIAFHDNAGAIEGRCVRVFAPENPGQPSPFRLVPAMQHITATAETHNHPTLIAPFPGAETGAGGRIRDNRAVGRGGLVHAGFAGYFTGNLHIPGYEIPGETVGGEKIRGQATPLEILIQGSNGISDYGNKIGEPLIGGFCRSFGQMVNGVRREALKPVLYSAGLGRLLDAHVKKHPPEKGMLIVRFGGPAYRIGVGGGSASSMTQGAQTEELDRKSVQRGNPEYENRGNRAIQAFAELGEDNPIESIHDQGAGGPSNVLTELMEPLGGRVDIHKITLGDRTMSILEIWVAEYQEGYGALVRRENIDLFMSICERERVNCEVLGEITGDGYIVVDAASSTPVNLPLKGILGDLPRKRFRSVRPRPAFSPLAIPSDLTVEQMLVKAFALLQVGSKRFLTNKADRSVTGLVARQQCCGPTQVPVSDVAVTADGYFDQTGAAGAIGENPNRLLISPAAGARMAVAEMLTNLASARISSLSDVKCRANWMWAAKLPGQGALLYDAAVAMRDIMLSLGIAADGGKDSLSMAAKLGLDLVASPGQLVIFGYAPVPDVTKVVTPDFKGSGCLGFINLGGTPRRLGGSALAQALGQLGDEPPDIDDVSLLANAFKAVQELIREGLITAYHDISDGGLISAVAEMCIAGNRGAEVVLGPDSDPLPALFAEEAGMLFEFESSARRAIVGVMSRHMVPCTEIGRVDAGEGGSLRIRSQKTTLLDRPVTELREWWEATSTALEVQQANPQMVEAESRSHAESKTLRYTLSFTPQAPRILKSRSPRVMVLREEGTNGDREMSAALTAAGHTPWDVSMSDLLEERANLDDFRGLVYPGGFSYGDACGSARGWAAPILFNPDLKKMFRRFYERPDTFSFGVCNGFQLMTQIGWLPYADLPEASQPRLVHNWSERFESRWAGVKILESPAIMFRGMEGSILGIWVAHGEGRLVFPDVRIAEEVREQKLVPLVYVDQYGEATEQYPHNPNGSPRGWTALCSRDGRHLGMMPHSERCFLLWQWSYMPPEFRHLKTSPWLQMFINAYNWCLEH